MNRRQLFRVIGRSATAAGLAAVLAALGACAGMDAPPEPPEFAQAVEYRLGPGDALRLIVFGEEQLSGEFRVDNGGSVALPLIGEVPARGRTPRELEQEIAQRLGQGYVRDARVSVEVLNFRPFYIYGEVNRPGQYPYAPAMTAEAAVAVAGGYTYRANQNYILITRGRDPQKRQWRAPVSAPVFPDDVVRVPERYF